MIPSETKARISLPYADWPEADRHAWSNSSKPARFGVVKRPLADWSPGQVASAARWYGGWLNYSFSVDPASVDELPTERMNPSRLVGYLKDLHARVTPPSLARGVCDLYGIMTSIAPEQDWTWFRDVRRLASENARHYPPKPKQFVHAGELVKVGRHLLAAAYGGAEELVDPIAFRDGLIILMLIMVPVRITQFSAVEPAKHFLQDESCEWVVHWDAPETKTRRADDHPVPKPLIELLRIYFDVVRPALRARRPKSQNAETLWVGNSGITIGSQTLRKIIQARTKAALGRAVNPHVFRSSAATTYVLEAPEHAMEAGALLGHTNFDTTQRYYLLGHRVKAIKMAHAALEAVANRGAARSNAGRAASDTSRAIDCTAL